MYSSAGHHCQSVRDMNSAINLLDKYKKACSIASDNACAGSLGVSRQAVSKWRNGENHPDADVVEKMCEATGEPLARWLPLIEAERARSPGARRAWLRLAQVAATLAGIYIVSQHGLDMHEAALFGMAQVDIMRNYGGAAAFGTSPPKASAICGIYCLTNCRRWAELRITQHEVSPRLCRGILT